jgi:hypothetical protein
MKTKTLISIHIVTLVALFSASCVNVPQPRMSESWTFVSIPDFLNVDTLYPEPKWEDALTYTLKSIKAENPDFVLVAGDEVTLGLPRQTP